MGKKFGEPASLSGGPDGDRFVEARKVNSASRDQLPALPIGDVGYGTPSMDAGGARYAESDAVPTPEPKTDGGGLAGPEQPSMSSPRGMHGTTAASPATRARTPQELMDMAHQMLDSQSVQHQALLGAGSSVGQRDDSGGKIPDWLVNEMRKDEQR